MAMGFRLFFVFSMFVILTIPLLPLQYVATWLERFWFKSLPHFWHRRICSLLGIHVQLKGTISDKRPLLLVANHVSWIDILVLGSLAELSFIAKNEIEGWPLFGTFAKFQRTVFIDRKTQRKVGEQSQEIADRLKAGDILVLFPEGTTSDGNRVFPFKSSLFGAAKMALDDNAPDAQVFIQPVTLAYTKCHGIPLGRYHRAIVGWPGTVGLKKSLLGLVRAGSITVDVTCGDLEVYDHSTDRKRFAQSMQAKVREMLEASLYRLPGKQPISDHTAQIASKVEAKPINGHA